MKVLIPTDICDEGKADLARHGYDVVVGNGCDEAFLMREIADADALLARTEPIPNSLIAAAKKLKIIARHGVGTDNIDVEYCSRRGIFVTVAKHCNNASVAEHALMLMLACAKAVVRFHRETVRGNWRIRDQIHGVELGGKTLGAIGLGAIGADVARRAHYGLDMKVIGYDAYASGDQVPPYVSRMQSVESVCRSADVVSLHIPATGETRNLFDRGMLARMKPDAILVNTARGGIVNEEDLYDALANGRLRAAGFDVFAQEAHNVDNRLFHLPNFIATPHVGGLTHEACVAMAMSSAKAIHDVLSGREPDYPVNTPVMRLTR